MALLIKKDTTIATAPRINIDLPKNSLSFTIHQKIKINYIMQISKIVSFLL